MRDIDFRERCCTVVGKGGKIRRVYFGADVHRALWDYLRHERREPEEALFIAERGRGHYYALTRSGAFQVV
jgi:site-specific recombinase XerC